jgi:predicted alpha/beta-fold hydrolase
MNFNPALGLSNKHLQTIYSTFFTKKLNLKFEIEKFTLSDGDFVECYWHNTNKHPTKIVIMFHGLAGSWQSPYIQGAMQQLSNAGITSVLMHFRGCGKYENLYPRSYHSGDTADALEFIKSTQKRFPDTQIYTIGYSLGANMLLKLLGENKENIPIKKAIAVSPPMLLDICAIKMDKGFSKIYQKRLLKDLQSALEKKYISHDMNKYIKLKQKDIKNLDTFYKFDDAYTAPIHGFLSAQDYYEKCSSRQYLKDIKVPTLIIHSKDDPFMTTDVIPNNNELSNFVKLILTEKGGHVGFISGSIFKPIYWLEYKIVEFFTL